MHHFHLFTDGSVHTQSKFGVGAYLLLADTNIPIDSLHEEIKLKLFDNTSSTKLELQTLVWALNDLNAQELGKDHTLTIYTDSQNIVSLPARQARLETNHYMSRKHKLLANAEIYKTFYKLSDKWPENANKHRSNTCTSKYTLVKVKGHKASSEKDKIDQIFSMVDRAARHKLREAIMGNA